jgi:hypothetical protein
VRSDVQRIGRIGLGLRDEHLGPGVVGERSVAAVGDDADDLALGLVGELLHHAAADNQPVVQRIALARSASPSPR